MAFCPSCGSPVDAAGTSCAKCGGPSSAPSAPPPTPVYVTAPGPNSWQQGGAPPAYGATLPDPSPLALILAAAAWVVGCGPLLSIPAWIKARSDIRSIQEGRLNPSGLGMCQVAYWVALINVILFGFGLVIAAIAMIFMFAAVAAVPKHMTVRAPVSASSSMSVSARPYEAVERDVENLMVARPESERKLWRQACEDLRIMRRQKGTGMLPVAKGLPELLRAAESSEPLWTALTALEQKAAKESGRVAPTRPRPASFLPAEAPERGPPEEEDEDD
ncbi:MAG: hypothetical protein FD180_3383 [Planctomycetota bacterium]|nr:MAG: hypothetical protein FD180_3383 [Planctomycetota bacterium]